MYQRVPAHVLIVDRKHKRHITRFSLFVKYQYFTRLYGVNNGPVCFHILLINSELRKTPNIPSRAATAPPGIIPMLLPTGQLPCLLATGTPDESPIALSRRSPVTAGRDVRRWCHILPSPTPSCLPHSPSRQPCPPRSCPAPTYPRVVFTNSQSINIISDYTW